MVGVVIVVVIDVVVVVARTVRTVSGLRRERAKSLSLPGRGRGRIGAFENAEENADAVDSNASSRILNFTAFTFSFNRQCSTLYDMI